MKHTLIFILLISAVTIFLDYPSIYDKLPYSAHQWRQADGTSMALNYYQNGMDFWKPQVHHLLGFEGYGVGEFPILYYTVAGLYKVFGVDEGLFRVLSFLIFVIGLLALSKLILKVTDDDLLSFAIPLWIWTSPIIAFYAFNFLPNVPALGLAMMGWYYFYLFYEKGRTKWLYWSCLWFLMAGLLKITALITFVPILGAYVFELFGIMNFKKDKPLFQAKGWNVIPFILTLGITVAWYLFAIQYNSTHHTTYFRTTSWAIWNMEWKDIQYTFRRLVNPWLPHYFHLTSHILTASLLGWIIFTPKRHPKFLYWLTVISFIGVIAYMLVWYYAFSVHDYYMINPIVVPAIVATVGGIYLKNNQSWMLRSWWFKIGVIVFVMINLGHTKSNMTERYAAEGKYHYINKAFYDHEGVRAFLSENGIQRPDRVISIPDRSPNASLYYMNLPGWTQLYHLEPYDTEKVKQFAGYGAKYLIISDTSYLSRPDLQGAFVKPVANYKREIFVFDIQNLE